MYVLAATLTRVTRAAMPVSAVAAVSVLHSAAVGGSGAGDVGQNWGGRHCCKLRVCQF